MPLVQKRITPRMILSRLGKKVVGQQGPKELLSLSLYQHMVNLLAFNNTGVMYESMRPLPLIMGESGNGKTFMIKEGLKVMRKICEDEDLFPLVEIDCTQLSPTGFVGQSFSSLIANHVKQYSKTDKDYLNSTVVYLDEFDKITTPLMTSAGDNWHKEIQYTLLKLIEGGEQIVEESRGSQSLKVDTSSWLFIVSGNFSEVRKLRDELKEDRIPLGFTALEDKNPNLKAQRTHLKALLQHKNVGMATQLAGRITNIAEVKPLNREELHTICVKNIIPDIVKFFEFLDYTIYISEEQINNAIDRCENLKLGARGLKGELFNEVKESLETTFFEFSIPKTEAQQEKTYNVQLTILPPGEKPEEPK